MERHRIDDKRLLERFGQIQRTVFEIINGAIAAIVDVMLAIVLTYTLMEDKPVIDWHQVPIVMTIDMLVGLGFFAGIRSALWITGRAYWKEAAATTQPPFTWRAN
jgi:hypothetical protein